MQKIVRTLQLRGALAGIAVAAVTLTMASSAFAASAAPAAPARAEVFSQSKAAVAYVAALQAGADGIDAAVAAARSLLAASGSLVADEAVRTGLSSAIGDAVSASADARRELVVAKLADDPIDRSGADYLRVVLGRLTGAEAAVTASEAQQAANIAEQRAAAQRAAATAAAAIAQAQAAAVIHTVNVWSAGWQPQINQCRGAVDITAHYGPATIAERWECGGRAFPTTPGSTIRITGARGGTYTVLGIVRVLNAYTANASQVPGGYDLLYQTCRGGDAHATDFIALKRQ